MISTPGRSKGHPKTGGRKPGSITVQSSRVKQAILTLFEELNGENGDAYLREVAASDPKLFLGLVAKILPSSVEQKIEVEHKLDLGRAMREAEARVANYRPTTVIDHTPSHTFSALPEPVTEPIEAVTRYEGYDD